MEWANTLSGQDQQTALEWALPTLLRKDGAAALEQTLALADPEKRSGIISHNYIDQQPEDQRIQALETLPPGMATPQHYGSVAHEHSATATRETSEWINSLPPGPQKDGAIRGMLQVLQITEPSDALVWAASVQAPEERAARLAEVVNAWNGQDPVAAAAGIQASALPEEEKMQFLQTLTLPAAP